MDFSDLSMEKVLINFQTLDPIEFGKQILLKFEIYLRIVIILFAIIVFGCISDQSIYTEADPRTGNPIVLCLFNGDMGTCNYGITVGVIAFISNIVFVCLDVVMEVVIHPIIYRIIALSMLLFNAFWGFNYFILFCLLANRWSNTPEIIKSAISPLAFNDSQSAIAFSFFSVILYIGIGLLGVFRVIRGPGFIGDIGYYQQLMQQKSPYGKFDSTEAGTDSYQAPREETY